MLFNSFGSSNNQKPTDAVFCSSQNAEIVSEITETTKNDFLNKKIKKDQSAIARVEHEVDSSQFLFSNIAEEDIGILGKGKKFLFKCSSGEKVLSIIIDTGSSTTLISSH